MTAQHVMGAIRFGRFGWTTRAADVKRHGLDVRELVRLARTVVVEGVVVEERAEQAREVA